MVLRTKFSYTIKEYPFSLGQRDYAHSKKIGQLKDFKVVVIQMPFNPDMQCDTISIKKPVNPIEINKAYFRIDFRKEQV